MSTKIKDSFFIGDLDSAQDRDFVDLNGIESILNLSSEYVPNVFGHVRYLNFQLDEIPPYKLFDLDGSDFQHMIEFINQALDQSISVLVHCYDGQAISPAVIMAYMMVQYTWSVDKTYEFLLSKHPDVKLHQAYVDQLYALELQMLGRLEYDRDPNVQSNFSEWNAEFVNHHHHGISDELVLVNTYINVTRCCPAQSRESHRRGSRCTHARRLSWIDQQKQKPTQNPRRSRPSSASSWSRKSNTSSSASLERPPNWDYSSTSPKDGWIDTTKVMSRSASSRAFTPSRLSSQDDHRTEDEQEEEEERTEGSSDDRWDVSSPRPATTEVSSRLKVCTTDDAKKGKDDDDDEDPFAIHIDMVQRRSSQSGGGPSARPNHEPREPYVKPEDDEHRCGIDFPALEKKIRFQGPSVPTKKHRPTSAYTHSTTSIQDRMMSNNWMTDDEPVTRPSRTSSKQPQVVEAKEEKYIPMYLRATKSSLNKSRYSTSSNNKPPVRQSSRQPPKQYKKRSDPLSNRLPRDWETSTEVLVDDPFMVVSGATCGNSREMQQHMPRKSRNSRQTTTTRVISNHHHASAYAQKSTSKHSRPGSARSRSSSNPQPPHPHRSSSTSRGQSTPFGTTTLEEHKCSTYRRASFSSR